MKTKSNAIKLLSIVMMMLFVGFMAVCRRTAVTGIIQPTTPISQKSFSGEPIISIPTTVDLDPAKVALGEKLFNEPQLSHDDTVSCATCHALDLGGTDQKSHSTGINGQVGGVNAPTVYNSGYNFKQ